MTCGDPSRAREAAPAATSAAASSALVRCRPSRSARAMAAWQRARNRESMPAARRGYTAAALTRGAVSASIQRTSAAATRCQVGLSTCVRISAPASHAPRTSRSVAPRSRWPTAHRDEVKSWAWTAPNQATRSAGRANRRRESCWLSSRRART